MALVETVQVLTPQGKAFLRKSVAAGVKVLDKNVPGWFDRVSLDDLDMSNEEYCVVGQLFMKNFLAGLVKLEIHGLGSAGELGFNLPRDVSSKETLEEERDNEEKFYWSVLGEAWAEVIKKKRNAASATKKKGRKSA